MAALTGLGAPLLAAAAAAPDLGIKALAFDIYGTCTDYWTDFMRQGAVLNAAKGLSIDWAALLIQMGGAFPPSLMQLLKKERVAEHFVVAARKP